MGAVNAYIMAMYPPGDEDKAAADLTSFWLKLEQDMVYKNWPLWLLQGLFFKSGIYNSEPFADTLEELASKYPEGYKRSFSIALTELNSGNYTRDDITDRFLQCG